MRSIDALLATDQATWPAIRDELRSAAVPIDILPARVGGTVSTGCSDGRVRAMIDRRLYLPNSWTTEDDF